MKKIISIFFMLLLSVQTFAVVVDYPVSTATLNVSVWGTDWIQHTDDAQARDDLDIENHNLIAVDVSGNTKWTGSLIVTGSARVTAGFSVASANAATGQILATTARFGGTVTANYGYIKTGLSVASSNAATGQILASTARFSGTVTANAVYIKSGLSIASSNAASGQILAGTARFSGTVTANALYLADFSCGEMFVSYNATAMNLVNADTYYTVTSNVLAGDLDDFTFTNSGTDCYLTVGKSGLYSFVGSLSFSGGNGDEFHGGLSVNNAAPDGCCEFNRKMGAGGDVGSAAFSGIKRLTAGNTIRVKIENITDADDPTIVVMNVQLVKIAP